MNNKTKGDTTALFIGRCEPPHLGHNNGIKKLLNSHDKVVVAIGSAFSSRTIKNPFSYVERREMLLNAFDNNPNLIIEPLGDHPYNETKWINQVQRLVRKHGITTIGGHKKDHTSYYLDFFKNIPFIDIGNENIKLDATEIRNIYFGEKPIHFLKGVLDTTTLEFLENFKTTDVFARLVREFKTINELRKAWANTPHPVMFQTVDNVVISSGHLLCVRRKSCPGEGLLSLPGGFPKEREPLKDAALRFLMEKTNINIPKDNLKKSVVDNEYFDDPARSLRGRVVTQAFAYRLDDTKTLPVLKGSELVSSAVWVPLDELKEEDFFEDHYHIAMTMADRIG